MIKERASADRDEPGEPDTFTKINDALNILMWVGLFILALIVAGAYFYAKAKPWNSSQNAKQRSICATQPSKSESRQPQNGCARIFLGASRSWRSDSSSSSRSQSL